MQHKTVPIIFPITPQRDVMLYQIVKKYLLPIGDIDINLLVYMALNQLTINQTISASQTMNMEQLCNQHLSAYTYEQHCVVMQVCEQIACILYSDYNDAMTTAHLPTPAKMLSATYSDGVVSMIFDCLDDTSCTWSYTTSPLT